MEKPEDDPSVLDFPPISRPRFPRGQNDTNRDSQQLRSRVAFDIVQGFQNFFSRIFFDGIAVTRTKDEGDRTLNSDALEDCLRLLRTGGELFVFSL